MASVCVDASLVLMLLLPDEDSERVEALWSGWVGKRTTVLGPPLLFAEVPSVLRHTVHLGRIGAPEGEGLFRAFCDLGIVVSERRDLHTLAWDLAKRHNRPRLYDSMYLAAAMAEECDLWTGDLRLANAVGLDWVRPVRPVSS